MNCTKRHCDKSALPGMTVCFEHADKSAIIVFINQVEQLQNRLDCKTIDWNWERQRHASYKRQYEDETERYRKLSAENARLQKELDVCKYVEKTDALRAELAEARAEVERLRERLEDEETDNYELHREKMEFFDDAFECRNAKAELIKVKKERDALQARIDGVKRLAENSCHSKFSSDLAFDILEVLNKESEG